MHHLRFTWYVPHYPSYVYIILTYVTTTGISDAYYCAECTRLEKDRDGCPKIVNLGASRTDLFYERRRLGMSGIPLFSEMLLTDSPLKGFKKG